MTEPKIPALVLGATGYVGAEVLRLLAAHPRLEIVGVVSRSRAGERVEAVHPHLSGPVGGLSLETPEDIARHLEGRGSLAVFSCLPHGATAKTLAAFLETARAVGGREPVIVDLSADFRYASPADYETVYGRPHGAPELCEHFHCGLPDLEAETPARHLAHPGCFTTAVSLASAPLVATGRVRGALAVTAVTGSTGSGREASPTTHHPERFGNLKAYKPLGHRHRPEMEGLVRRFAGREIEIAFVPCSGPFARGIHATVQAELEDEMALEDLLAAYTEAYAGAASIHVSATPPSLKHVVGSNRCRIGIAVSGRRVVVTSVIDNLVKGAAGGGVQWMNRRLGLPALSGLETPGLGY